jgi:2-dehydro-3-deoxyphosphogluconate aldolase / (4S)-4-hydroxy-2-oxoglutarate aldolase
MRDVVRRIREERIVAVLRGVADVDGVVAALVEAGVGVVEITLDSDDALETIARLRKRGDVGVVAGTVRTAADAAAAAAAGAEACVGPALSAAVVEQCRALDVPQIPGALTPSEIASAHDAGAPLVKLFPARAFGPSYVADVLKPLPDVALLCTGGVTSGNARDYLEAGAAAVGVSFRDTASAAADARRLVAAAAEAPSPHGENGGGRR